jgi:hypothetical protein
MVGGFIVYDSPAGHSLISRYARLHGNRFGLRNRTLAGANNSDIPWQSGVVEDASIIRSLSPSG